MKQELFDDAEKIYLSLIESQSLDQSSYKNLILLYGIKNDFEKAETELASYKEKFPLDETIITIETEISNLKKKFEEEQMKAQEEVEKSEENTNEKSEVIADKE
jgi:lipopolysaccharide biosynthesis regulator YciM